MSDIHISKYFDNKDLLSFSIINKTIAKTYQDNINENSVNHVKINKLIITNINESFKSIFIQGKTRFIVERKLIEISQIILFGKEGALNAERLNIQNYYKKLRIWIKISK